MNPQNTNEKRKAGLSSILGGIAVGIVIVFELTYMVMTSLPNDGFFARFSPKISEEDMVMLNANIPGQAEAQSEQEENLSEKQEPVAAEAATAVDAALQKDQVVSKAKTSKGIPSVLGGADDVEWSVVDTNEFQQMIDATNAVLRAVTETNESPETIEFPESEEKTAEEVVPVG